MRFNYIIATDLDGTLMDHHDYSCTAAIPAIRRCQSLGVPIIFNTSKTYAEARSLQRTLNLDAPVIVENGSAIVIPGALSNKPTEHMFGASRVDVIGFINDVRNKYEWQFEGFNDWSLEEIVKYTGLSDDEAAKASIKQYSEPFIWQDTAVALDKFTKLAKLKGLSVLKGGRFHHLQGQTDKAKPLAWLMKNHSKLFPQMNEQPTVIALGDSHNDIAMLNAADIAVCVRSPVADYPKLSRKDKEIKTNAFGPVGWNEAVLKILAEY